MRALFADTFYYLALISEDDGAHQRAVEFSRALHVRTVTTAWVITEVADALSAPSQRRTFLAFLERLRSNPSVVLLPPSEDLFAAGLNLYAQRLDKNWSLTDCISFVVMDRFNLTDALTGDHHFEQAGFKALLL